MQKHIFIITGEASGDEHAAKLIRELNSQPGVPPLKISGIGGDAMIEAGCEVIYPLAKYGVTGLTEIVQQWKHIRSAFRLGQNFISQNQIDLLILVDYPGFNLRFAKWAKSQGIKILYYISPQIWAWKAKRIHKIKQRVDMMAVILPFEKEIYAKHQIPCRFVGHPLTDQLQLSAPKADLMKRFGLSEAKRQIALLPGSRRNEIKQLLPYMATLAQSLDRKYPDQLQFVLPVASSLTPDILEPYIAGLSVDLKIITNASTPDILSCSQLAIVASGTASLQAALLAIPSIIIYRASRLTYVVATQVIQCAYLGLANLIAGKMIQPELVQDDLNDKNLLLQADNLLNNRTVVQNIVRDLKKTSKMLENISIDCRLAQLVFQMLSITKTSIKDTSKSSGNPQFEVKKTSDSIATPVESQSVT